MDTPRKNIVRTIRKCVTCASEQKRLHNLNNNKARNLNVHTVLSQLISLDIPSSLFDNIFICDSCIVFLDKFSKFRQVAVECVSNLNKSADFKRCAKTPPSALKLTVAERLERSVEKLKRLKISDDVRPIERKSSSKRRIQFTQPTPKDDKENCEPGSDNDLLFDHSYRKPPVSFGISNDFDVGSVLDDCLDCTKDDSFLKNLDRELEQLCAPGCSVLFKKSPLYLKVPHYFESVIAEMSIQCPDLLKILTVALGSKIGLPSRMATISTVYGMILHSRNNQVSGIQRLYTALAVRYHADNKV
ncbi:hypothetical protein CI610_03528 [invertebrate metagenome]|uniref:ZAD domain-containing protein n=1 Tax=invertebrate metagenome TaxID=1711999 RepID=A0A2H9T2U3_9ZZZZ